LEVNNDNVFVWYHVPNEQAFLEIEEAYFLYQSVYHHPFVKPSSYPEIICVETSDVSYEDVYDGEGHAYILSQLMEDTKTFWEKMGYHVKIEKVN
jgi:hypothetical protein